MQMKVNLWTVLAPALSVGERARLRVGVHPFHPASNLSPVFRTWMSIVNRKS